MTKADDRRERLAGLLECMRDECARRGLEYGDELATLAICWHAISLRQPDGSPSRTMLDGKEPVELKAFKKTERVGPSKSSAQHQAKPRTDDRRGHIRVLPHEITEEAKAEHGRNAKHYIMGRRAAETGVPREASLGIAAQGGYRAAWIAGWESV